MIASRRAAIALADRMREATVALTEAQRASNEEIECRRSLAAATEISRHAAAAAEDAARAVQQAQLALAQAVADEANPEGKKKK